MKKLHGQYFSENSVLNAAVQEYARKFGKAPDKAAFMNMRAQFSKPVAAPQAKPTPKPAAGTVKAKGYTAADRAYFANPLGIRQPTTHKKAAPRAKTLVDSLRGGIPVPEYRPQPMTSLEEDDIKAFSPSRQDSTAEQRASRSLLKFGTEQVESTGKGVKWIAGATGLHPSVMFEPIVAKQEEARKRILDDPENQAGASNLAMLGGGGAAFGIARIPAELGFGAYSAYATAKGIEDAGGIGNYLLDHTGEAGMNALGLLAGVHGHFGALKALEPRIGKALNAELARGRTPPVPPTMLGQSYRVPAIPDTARNASPIAPPVLRQPTRTRLAPVDRTPVVGGRVATAKAPVVLGSRTRTAKVAPVVEEPVATPQVEAPGITAYHGTDAEFDTFDLNHSKQMGKFGHWFTPDEEFAGLFGKNVKKVELAIRNPKVITEGQWNAIREAHAKDGAWFQRWRDQLISEGHDGLHVKGEAAKLGRYDLPPKDVFAAFHDSQIRVTPPAPVAEPAPVKQSVTTEPVAPSPVRVPEGSTVKTAEPVSPAGDKPPAVVTLRSITDAPDWIGKAKNGDYAVVETDRLSKYGIDRGDILRVDNANDISGGYNAKRMTVVSGRNVGKETKLTVPDLGGLRLAEKPTPERPVALTQDKVGQTADKVGQTSAGEKPPPVRVPEGSAVKTVEPVAVTPETATNPVIREMHEPSPVELTAPPEQVFTRTRNGKADVPSKRTGLTPTQTDVLAAKLQQVALQDRPGQMGPDGFEFSQEYSIDVPDDGTFYVRGTQEANALHQAVTGKPIEGFDKVKLIPEKRNTPPNTRERIFGSNPYNESSISREAVVAYGDGDKALAALIRQRDYLLEHPKAAHDQNEAIRLDEAIKELEIRGHTPTPPVDTSMSTPAGKAARPRKPGGSEAKALEKAAKDAEARLAFQQSELAKMEGRTPPMGLSRDEFADVVSGRASSRKLRETGEHARALKQSGKEMAVDDPVNQAYLRAVEQENAVRRAVMDANGSKLHAADVPWERLDAGAEYDRLANASTPDGKAARPRARRKGQGGHFIAGVPNVKGITDWIPRKLNGKWLDPLGNEVPPHIMRLFESAGALRGIPGYNGETFKETRTRPVVVNPKFQNRRVVPKTKPAPVRVRPASTTPTVKPPVGAQKPQPATSTTKPVSEGGKAVSPVEIKNAALDERRIEMGMEVLDETDKKGWQEAIENAKRKGLDKKVDEIVARGDGLTSDEAAGLMIGLTEKDNAVLDAANKGDMAEWKRLQDGYDEFTQALKRTKGDVGRTLNEFKMAMNRGDYTLAEIIQKAAENKGKPLTEKEMLDLRSRYKELEELKAKLPEAEAENVRLRAELDRVSAEKELRKAVINRDKSVKVDRIRQQREADIKQLESLISRAHSGLDPQELYLLGKVAKSYVHEGIVNLDAVVKRAMVDVKGVTAEDVYQAINAKNPNPKEQSPKAQQTRTLKAEATLADLQGQLKTGRPRLPQKSTSGVVPNSQLERTQISIRKARRDIRIAIDNHKSVFSREKGYGYDLVNNTLREMKATADLSATLRQGAILVARDLSRGPKGATALANKFGKSIIATISKYGDEQIHNEMVNDPRFYEFQKAGGHFSEFSGGQTRGEEMYNSALAERIPVFGEIARGSERHMRTFLNLMRTDAFYKFMDANPNATPAELKGAADIINIFSGRGDLGKAGAVSQWLGRGFFAPRFAVSRIEAPLTPLKYSLGDKNLPSVRKEAIKSMAATAAFGGSIMAMAALGGAEVTADPKSSDWGKIKWGDTRFDVWAGMQQPARLLMQSLLFNDFDAVGGASRFISYKMAPAISTPLELRSKKSITGQKATRAETLKNMAIPIAWTDIYDAYKSGGLPRAGVVGAATTMGLSTSTYKKKK